VDDPLMVLKAVLFAMRCLAMQPEGVEAADHVHDPQVGLWLESVNPGLARYATAFEELGLNSRGAVMAASAEDLDEAFSAVGFKKPHRRLIVRQREEFAKEQEGACPESEQDHVKFEEHYSNRALSSAKREAWFENWAAESTEPALLNAVDRQQWKEVLRMCRKDEIEPEAQVYDVPVLNWVGQFIEARQNVILHKLMACLFSLGSGDAADLQSINVTLSAGLVPPVVKAYQKLPLLLQATELGRTDIMPIALEYGASLEISHRLPDGRSSGLTPLHVSQLLSDPTEQIHEMNQIFFNSDTNMLLPNAEADIQLLHRLGDQVRSGGDARSLLLGMEDAYEQAAERVQAAVKGIKKAAKAARKHDGRFKWPQKLVQTVRNCLCSQVLTCLLDSDQAKALAARVNNGTELDSRYH
jgi:hypothetical protein